MKPNHRILTAVVAGLMLISASCSRSKRAGDAAAPTAVATGIPPVAELVSAIGGDSVEVSCLLPDGADPEAFDPGVSAMRRVAGSDIYFSIGSLPFETQLLNGIGVNNPKLEIINITDSISPIYGTHGNEPDPHVWMSLRNRRIMARNVLAALSRRRPTSAAYFTARYRALDLQLDSLDRAITEQLDPVKGRTFIVGHPSMTYFARDYGLKQLALTQGHKESSAIALKERMNEAADADALAVISQPGTQGNTTAELAEKLRLKNIVIDPMSGQTVSQIQEVARALAPTLPPVGNSL